MVAKQYWHYTVFEHLQSIVSNRMINTADTWVSRKVKGTLQEGCLKKIPG
jgi:hypothetical protein